MATVPAPSDPADRHTAFGSQLVDVHLWLREELARLRGGLDAYLAGTGERPRDLRAHCLAFCSALTRHHTAEDDGVFPALAAAHPELRPVLDELAHDHVQVEEVLIRLQTLLDELPTGRDGTLGPEETRWVSGELDGLIALVESHFTYEEKKLVAALNGLGVPLSDDFALRDLTGG
ncbi:hemerythrin domain-containing protein [Streptomyces sp. NRRL F-5727]|uniref:hemerythrin domain-containing protein n=1 Tax=Streptomyces sp. NRRL F-5727 TaxID=1463871 RepID=UPI00068EEF20|nr:hemerythrin domain-containing protein [Streptomyces sp. NRRL F-5727]